MGSVLESAPAGHFGAPCLSSFACRIAEEPLDATENIFATTTLAKFEIYEHQGLKKNQTNLRNWCQRNFRALSPGAVRGSQHILAGMNKHKDSPAFLELQVILQDCEVRLEVVDVQSQCNDICCDFSLH